METGGRPEFGVRAAVDVHYLSTCGAWAAAVLAADAAFAAHGRPVPAARRTAPC